MLQCRNGGGGARVGTRELQAPARSTAQKGVQMQTRGKLPPRLGQGVAEGGGTSSRRHPKGKVSLLCLSPNVFTQ